MISKVVRKSCQNLIIKKIIFQSYISNQKLDFDNMAHMYCAKNFLNN